MDRRDRFDMLLLVMLVLFTVAFAIMCLKSWGG